MSSRLVNRNVTVSGHRTSMRLEPELWEALTEIARREERTVNEICTEVDRRRGESTLTSAIRVFIVTYFRSLAPRPDKSPTPGSSRARSPRARNQAARRRGAAPPSGGGPHGKRGPMRSLGATMSTPTP